MERVKLCCGGEAAGEVALCPEGARTVIRASMEDPGDGLYRAWLVGQLRRGEARCSLRFGGETPWRETERPAGLFRSGFFQSRLGRFGRAWHRREGERLELALPLEKGGPFPLEALFCLGRLEKVEGRLCVVYAFQGEEPVSW